MKPSSSGSGTIRFRITALATIVVAVVLLVVAIALVVLVRQQLFANLDNSLEQRADTYETSFLEEDNDDLLLLLNTNDEDRAAQLAAPAGTVIASTGNLAGAAVFDDSGRPSGVQRFRSATIAGLEDDAFRVLSRDVDTDSGSAVLHVAQNIDDLNDTIRSVTIALAIAVPLIVMILAALVWWLVGRTLRPVELMRTEVAEITGTDLRRRLLVPDQADEIARLAVTMNQMLDRIDKAGRRQQQFVADASHELRTPLTRIRTELEVDLNQPDVADPTATHEAVLEEAIAVQTLLDDLLFLARSDERQHANNDEPVDLDDIVFREAAQQRTHTDVPIDTSGVSGAHLMGDANQLRRVVRNLLSNAIRHSTHAVNVTLTEQHDRIHLIVTDDGPGVPQDSRERIFERFGRADDARTRHDGGTGLGLAIVSDIVDRHGGNVRYDNAWSTGARFIVELPTTEET